MTYLVTTITFVVAEITFKVACDDVLNGLDQIFFVAKITFVVAHWLR